MPIHDFVFLYILWFVDIVSLVNNRGELDVENKASQPNRLANELQSEVDSLQIQVALNRYIERELCLATSYD